MFKDLWTEKCYPIVMMDLLRALESFSFKKAPDFPHPCTEYGKGNDVALESCGLCECFTRCR